MAKKGIRRGVLRHDHTYAKKCDDALAMCARIDALVHIRRSEENGKPILGGLCGKKIVNRSKDTHSTISYCEKPAGDGTKYPVGRCSRHRPASDMYVDVYGAWIMAHMIAMEEDISPWDALLREVKQAAGEVAWLQKKVSEAPDDASLLDPEGYASWLQQWREARKELVRTAKIAIACGIEERAVQIMEQQAMNIAMILNAALASLDLDPEQEALARGIMRTKMLELEGVLT